MFSDQVAPIFESQRRTFTYLPINNLTFPYICDLYGSNSKSVVKQSKKQITKLKPSQNYSFLH